MTRLAKKDLPLAPNPEDSLLRGAQSVVVGYLFKRLGLIQDVSNRELFLIQALERIADGKAGNYASIKALARQSVELWQAEAPPPFGTKVLESCPHCGNETGTPELEAGGKKSKA